MKRMVTMSMVAAAAWIGAACADDPDTDLDVVGDTAAVDTAAPPAGAPLGAGGLGIDSLPDLGAYLTDGTGRAVYLLEGEPADSVTCRDACAEEWPPVPASQAAASPAGIRRDLVGSLQRPDGTMQMTYGGRALYYYHDDQGAGQTMGQHVTDQWGTWYLVTPEGEPLTGAGQPAGG